jgi:hypothetical protein
MFCAQSVAAAVEAKRVEEMIREAIERERREAEIAAKLKENIQKFVSEDMQKIDAFIEKRLIEGKGVFRHVICDNFCGGARKGFVYFGRRADPYRPSLPNKPYWSHYVVSEWQDYPIHLETYIEHLKSLCFEVTFEKETWTGYSSTGKSSCTMESLILVVKVPKELPCT